LTGAVAADPTVQPMSILGAVLTVVWDAEDETPKVNGIVGYPVLGIVCTVPDDAETIGTLKLGADDHGFWAAVARTVPEVIATRLVPPEEATMTRGADDSWMIPDEAETIGMLKPGAELHGLVPAVAVTVPEVTATRLVPPDDATMTSGALLRVTVPEEIAMAEDSETAVVPPATNVTSTPPDVVTGPMPLELPTMLIAVEAVTDSVPPTMVTSRPPEVVTTAAPLLDPTRLMAVEPDAAPPRIVTPRPPEVVTGAIPPDVPTTLTSVEPEAAPPRMVTPIPPEVVTGATPLEVPTMLIAVLAVREPPRIVTPTPPEVVTGAIPSDVPTMVTVGTPLIWTSPLDTETIGMLKLGALLHGLVPAVAVTVWTDDSVIIPDDNPPEICTSPDEAETIGMLNPGAQDQGFVAAVAVTVCTDDREMIPDEALTIGTLKLGAEDQGFVAAVAVTVPDVIARRAVPPEEATMTSGAEDIVIRPDDRLARRPAEVVTGATAVEAAAPTTRT
jgi:hypothetical protein